MRIEKTNRNTRVVVVEVLVSLLFIPDKNDKIKRINESKYKKQIQTNEIEVLWYILERMPLLLIISGSFVGL